MESHVSSTASASKQNETPKSPGSSWRPHSVPTCSNCAHRQCNECGIQTCSGRPNIWFYFPVHLRNRKEWKETEFLIGCCQCGDVRHLISWYFPDPPFPVEERLRPDMSETELEVEKIALEASVEWGLLTRAEADEWLSKWEKQPDGSYMNEEEFLKKLAVEEET